MSNLSRICLIGYGEVGQIIGDDLKARGAALSAWDLKFADPQSACARAIATRAIRAGESAADAAHDADLVICAVTAAQDVEAARAAARGMKRGAYFLDLNSASPGMKIEAARLVEAAGGLYVEAAVMSPVPPKRLGSPILLGGPRAEALAPALRDLGFSATQVFASELGKASAAKMCRSVMVKGIEALLTESLLAARHHGVEDTVLASLHDLLPGPDWPKLARYMISRALEHGTRRAEEMREAARTVREAGLDPLMSAACAERQAWAPTYASALSEAELKPMLDAIRAQIPSERQA